MKWEMLLLAFAAGVVTFFNPCGFALLPAYIAHYLGQRQGGARGESSWLVRGWRGLQVGLVVSAGFFTVFSVLGLVFSALGNVVLAQIGSYLPWVAAAIGGLLIVLGVLMLFGSLVLGLPLEAFAARLGTPQNGLRAYYLYGMGYAVGSIGCVFPIFFVWVVQPLLQGFVSGLLNFFAYALGMALMMIVLSLVMSFSKGLMENYLRPLLRYVPKAAALVMIGAGAYLVYYNLIYSGVIRF